MTFKVFCPALGGRIENAQQAIAITHAGAAFDWCRTKFSHDPEFASTINGRDIVVVSVFSQEQKVLKVEVRTVPEWNFKEVQ